MSYGSGGEEGGCGGMFLADTMNTLYFLEALIFSCYLSFYKPVSMRTADLKMVLGQVTRVKFLATYEASILRNKRGICIAGKVAFAARRLTSRPGE